MGIPFFFHPKIISSLGVDLLSASFISDPGVILVFKLTSDLRGHPLASSVASGTVYHMEEWIPDLRTQFHGADEAPKSA
jgi:hypothetical protein